MACELSQDASWAGGRKIVRPHGVPLLRLSTKELKNALAVVGKLGPGPSTFTKEETQTGVGRPEA